jgi:hypothetical protein
VIFATTPTKGEVNFAAFGFGLSGVLVASTFPPSRALARGGCWTVGAPAGDLVGERLADRAGLGALREHPGGVSLPPGHRITVGLALNVGGVERDVDKRSFDPLTVDRALRSVRRLLFEPHVHPDAIGRAPHMRVLAGVLPAALGGKPVAVNPRLVNHHLFPVASLGVLHLSLDGMNLTGERVEARAVAYRDEEIKLVVGRTSTDGALE